MNDLLHCHADRKFNWQAPKKIPVTKFAAEGMNMMFGDPAQAISTYPVPAFIFYLHPNISGTTSKTPGRDQGSEGTRRERRGQWWR